MACKAACIMPVLPHLTLVFLFLTGLWSSCLHHTCGNGGVQSRDVWCAHESGWATLENNCDPRQKPPVTQKCFHICPFHKYHFLWRTEPWGVCSPRSGRASCDQQYGVQRRNVSCVTKCGERLSSEYICERFEGKPPVQRICKLQCPVDCILSDFGTWNDCDRCWMQNQTRYRTVLALPMNGGVNCTSLSQTKHCEHRNNCPRSAYQYFRFKVASWGPCEHVDSKKRRRLRDFVGVLGERTRAVNCIDADGDHVEERYVTSRLHWIFFF